MNDATNDAIARAVGRFERRWGAPDAASRAPGRVNLIGDHTDYNEGFSLPMALPFDTAVAWGFLDDATGPITVDSTGYGTITIHDPGDSRRDPSAVPSWARHIVGVVALIGEHGVAAGGWRATIDTDIPTGASLSSSAALEVALITGLLHRAGSSWSPIEIARLGQRVENEFVGLRTGIMDQFISAGAIAGHASLMDCRASTLTPKPLPTGTVVAILDTQTRRVLADAEYGDRRSSCERAAEQLGVTALRDATIEQVATITDPTEQARARHVVTENLRTLAAADALAHSNAVELGRLMSESHLSLRDDFEVSGPGLDAIVDIAQRAPGCLGARMTGGGFAGCAVALVDRTSVDQFERFVIDRYDIDGHTAVVWVVAPSAGSSVTRYANS